MKRKYRRGIDIVDKSNFWLFLVIVIAIVTPIASANSEFFSALQNAFGTTGTSCGTCHIEPKGGGQLTSYGSHFSSHLALGENASDALATIGAPIVAEVSTGNLTIIAPQDIVANDTNISDLGAPNVTGGTPPYNITNDAPIGNFAIGETIVAWDVTDSVGATAVDTQTVTIEPTTGNLTIIAPEDIIKAATGLLTTIADLGTPTVTGGAPPYNLVNNFAVGDTIVTGNFAIGETIVKGNFAIGETTVTWSVTDSIGASAVDFQNVTITNESVEPTTGGKLTGKVFNDLNKDKALDTNEIGIAEMPVKLTGTGKSTKGIHKRTKTDIDGNYKFENLPPGRYVIHSKFKHGWRSTTRVTKIVLDLNNGETVSANFGKEKTSEN